MDSTSNKGNFFLSSFFTPLLTNLLLNLFQSGFTFHHAQREVVSMIRWLKEDEPNLIPNYAHTMIGIGGIVLNKNRQILAVSEKMSIGTNRWKLPGGYVEPGKYLMSSLA